MLTKQEILNKAVAGIRSQGGPSVSIHRGCLYRAANGRKCAIGWLIPNEIKAPEGLIVVQLSKKMFKSCGLSEEQPPLEFLNGLQLCHDANSLRGEQFMEFFNQDIKELCKKYELEYPAE